MKDISPKVRNASAGAAASTVLLYLAQLAGVQMDEPVAIAIVTLVVFLTGYFTSDPLRARKR